MEKFLKLGADPNKMGRNGNQPIHYLSMKKSEQYLFDILFEKSNNININAKNMYGNTPIRLAAKNDNLPGIKFLVKKKADLNIMGNFNYTPITSAAVFDNFKIFNYLLDAGANLLILDQDKNNILHKIAKSKRYKNKKHDKYIERISQLHPELIDMKNINDKTPKDILEIKK